MGKLRVQMISRGAHAVLKSPGVQAELNKRGQAMADRANASVGYDDGMSEPHFVAIENPAPSRARTTVACNTPHADNAQKSRAVLTRAIY